VGLLATIRSSLRSVFVPSGASSPPGAGGWSPAIVREPYTGAWQNNDPIRLETALANPTVFRCVSLIASDVGKLACRLVQQDQDGIWTETTSPAFSPVLRRPNRYQTAGQFFESWMFSKLLYGNTYVLTDRDDRHVVTSLYVLDPCRVKPLIAPDGAVYYEIDTSDLAGIPVDGGPIVVPAADLIHDRWNCAYHPLVGLSPLYACGGAAAQALAMQATSTAFFGNGGQPTGLLTPPENAPGLDPNTLARMRADFKAAGPNHTLLMSNFLKYTAMNATAAESQWIEQAGWTEETIAGCFGVPISMVNSSKQPPYANSEASTLQYHSQCLQTHLTAIETCLDAGLALPAPYGTEFDLDDLIWLDVATKTKAAHDAISAGAMSPNEARRKYFGLGPVPGGDSPFLQQQYYSLESLAMRDAAAPAPAGVAAPVAPAPADQVPA
jgi:HK97 family phage portal protein